MEKAIQDVMTNNMSKRKAAEMHSVKRSMLQVQAERSSFNGTGVISHKPYTLSLVKFFFSGRGTAACPVLLISLKNGLWIEHGEVVVFGL